jgi:predicted permease
MSLWSRLANVVRRDRLHQDIDDELQTHIDEAIAAGRDPLEARRALGSALRHREASRDIRLAGWLDAIRADAVFGWRRLQKHKVASGAAILSLALAIGACTSAFRLIDALLWRPLPIANPNRLWVVRFETIGADGTLASYDSTSYPMFRRMRDNLKEQATLMAVSYADRIDLTYGSDHDAEKAHWQFVSGSMFPTFGIGPALGRLFTENDDVTPGAHPYAVLSHDYWIRRFGRDPTVIGRTFHSGGTVYEIIGVAAEPFTGTETGVITDVFVPMMMKNPRTLASATNFWLRTLVELKPGVAPGRMHDELLAIFQAIKEERAKSTVLMPRQPKPLFEEKLLFEPAPAGSSNLQRDYRTSLFALAVLVGLVLLIACANVANLMTAQSAARAREMALRVSIGAGRARLIQLVLVESAMLAVVSAVLGGFFAWWTAPSIVNRINPPDDPARLVLSADWRVLGFSVLLTLAVTCLFGLTPALRASAVKPASALKGGEDPSARRRLMHGLIAAQVAFCVLVLFVTGLFVATFDRLSNQPLGFSAERVLNLEVVARDPQAPVSWSQVADHLRATPGVESVAMIGWPLMSGESQTTKVAIDGEASTVPSDVLRVSPGWLDTMRIRLIDGRDFRPEDTFPATAMVNEAFAKQYFEGANPVGKTFDTPSAGAPMVHVRVVGLVHDARSRDRMRRPILPTVYVPFQAVDAGAAPQAIGRGTFAVRTSIADPLALASLLRQEVSRTRAAFRVSNIRTQTAIDQAPLARERLLSMLALFFSGVALVLAGIGLYGVLDYTVLQRRREIGIRMALGAQRADIVRTVTLGVSAMVVVGALAGLALGMATTRYIEALFYGVKATDPAMLAGPASTLLIGVLVASLPPVIRAMRLNPVTTLRE